MTFNDGTFSWFQEGYFHAWDYEEITDNPLKDRLRDIYWKDGGAYPRFVTWSQGIWIFILLGVILEAVFSVMQAFPTKRKRRAETEEAAAQEELCIHTVQTVAFIGIFFFAMLFEGRARYLFPRAMSQVPCLHEHLANAARVKYPAALQRCKIDTPLLAAGSLIA